MTSPRKVLHQAVVHEVSAAQVVAAAVPCGYGLARLQDEEQRRRPLLPVEQEHVRFSRLLDRDALQDAGPELHVGVAGLQRHDGTNGIRQRDGRQKAPDAVVVCKEPVRACSRSCASGTSSLVNFLSKMDLLVASAHGIPVWPRTVAIRAARLSKRPTTRRATVVGANRTGSLRQALPRSAASALAPSTCSTLPGLRMLTRLFEGWSDANGCTMIGRHVDGAAVGQCTRALAPRSRRGGSRRGGLAPSPSGTSARV